MDEMNLIGVTDLLEALRPVLLAVAAGVLLVILVEAIWLLVSAVSGRHERRTHSS
jgi:hypothetical protein